MLLKGTPEYLRSDNGSEFTAKKIRKWLKNVEVITAYIEPGSPWENGYIESFNARMRDEFLNGELFGNMYEAQVLISRWVKYYNTVRPHSSLGGRPPKQNASGGRPDRQHPSTACPADHPGQSPVLRRVWRQD